MTKYRVFKRRPWKRNPKYPGGWEPHGGARKVTVRNGLSLAEARSMCEEANKNTPRKPGASWVEFEAQS